MYPTLLSQLSSGFISTELHGDLSASKRLGLAARDVTDLASVHAKETESQTRSIEPLFSIVALREICSPTSRPR